MADVSIEKFGGLNLLADPQEAGGEIAISSLNVALDRDGRIRTRNGYTSAYNTATTAYINNLHGVGDNLVLAAITSDTVRVVDVVAGTSAANVALGGGTAMFADAGTGVYFTDSTFTQIRKFVAPATFSSPAGLAAYEGRHIAVQPLDDRLVIADANNRSKLWFSDPATPETINVANFLELTPGDGEVITGMAVFGTELFVFKETKFFVFYGNSTDATGGAIFNYRMVDARVGCDNAGSFGKLVAAHETGVYFVGYGGVYRTTGAAPTLVSRPISPVFKRTGIDIPPPFSSVFATPNATWPHLGIVGDRLILTNRLNNTFTQFILDLRTGQWTVGDQQISSVLDGCLAATVSDSGDIADSAILGLLGGGLGNSVIGKSSTSETTDGGTAITWHHQSGFYDLGSQHSKRTRRSTLWGSGSPTLSVFTDHGTTDSNAAAVTLGTAPAVARGWHSKTYRGVLFSHKLSGSTAATVHRISHQVADERAGQ